MRGDRIYVRREVEADLFDLYVLRRAGDLLPFERVRRAMLLDSATMAGHPDRVADEE